MRLRILALAAVIAVLGGLLTGCKTDAPAASPGVENETPAFATPEKPADAIDPLSAEAGGALLYVEDLEVTGTAAPDRLTGFGLDVRLNPHLPYNFACYIAQDGTVSGVLPAGVDLSAVIPTFYYSGREVRLNGQPLVSEQTAMDLTAPVTLTLIDEAGGEHAITVKVQTLYTGLPSVALTTGNLAAITSKTETVDCTFYVGGGDPACCPYAAAQPVRTTAKARGRGNSSWDQEKKGYAVNLDNAAALLDMPSARKWALVANYEDKTLLRNYVADHVTAQTDLDSTLSVRPVDLWYNGDYWGTYNLCERVSVNPARVNITEQKDVSALEPSKVAYLFEFDGHVNEVTARQRKGWQSIGGVAYYDPVTDETFMRLTIGGKWVTIKQPEHDQLTPEMAQYVRVVMNQACTALKKNDWETIQSLMDVKSFVQWYLIEEFMNNTDSSMHSSVFMYLDVDGKLTMCTPWDFDRSSGNCDYWNAEGAPDSLYTSEAGWFSYLFQCEEARAMLRSEWETFHQKLADIGDVVNDDARMLSVSQQYNFQKWNILRRRVGANPEDVVRANTYDKQVTLLHDYLTQRLDSMDTFIRGLS